MIVKAQDILAANVKKYRKLRGLIQEKLSEMADISTDYLSEIERGKRIPRIVVIDRLAEALDIDSYRLFMP